MTKRADKPVRPETFALIMATAMTALRTVRMAHDDDQTLSSRMPKAWHRLLTAIKDFDRDFGTAIRKE